VLTRTIVMYARTASNAAKHSRAFPFRSFIPREREAIVTVLRGTRMRGGLAEQLRTPCLLALPHVLLA
jgi:hypothetical protein